MTLQGRQIIRAVVLDADGTLYRLRHSVGTLYSEVLTRFQISVKSGDLDQAVPRVWASFEDEYLARREGYQTDQMRERRLWGTFIKRMLEAVEIHNPSLTVTEALYQEFASGATRTLSEGIVEFLVMARNMGVVTVVATNNDDRTKSVMADLGVDAHIGHFFFSGELSWKKPSPNYFNEIARRLGLHGSRLLHVGNDVALDVHAAHSAGWQALLFDPEDRGPAPKVRSFSELGCFLRERMGEGL
jgi:putative hydrolase of the HAD superfamily